MSQHSAGYPPLKTAQHETPDVIALRGDDPWFWLDLGLDLLLWERVGEAASCFDQALDAAPRDLAALEARAQTHLAMGEIEPAIELLAQACEIQDDVAQLWNNRGVALVRAGRHEDALDSFARALELDPSDSCALGNRAMAHLVNDATDLALGDLAAAVVLDPTQPRTWACKAATHLHAGQLRLARHAFHQAARQTWARDGSKRHALMLMCAAAGLGLAVRFDHRERR